VVALVLLLLPPIIIIMIMPMIIVVVTWSSSAHSSVRVSGNASFMSDLLSCDLASQLHEEHDHRQ
jgi:hypothetical protein